MKANPAILLISFSLLAFQSNCVATQKSQLGQPLIQLSHGELSIRRVKFRCIFDQNQRFCRFYGASILTFNASLASRTGWELCHTTKIHHWSQQKIWDNQYGLIAKPKGKEDWPRWFDLPNQGRCMPNCGPNTQANCQVPVFRFSETQVLIDKLCFCCPWGGGIPSKSNAYRRTCRWSIICAVELHSLWEICCH